MAGEVESTTRLRLNASAKMKEKKKKNKIALNIEQMQNVQRIACQDRIVSNRYKMKGKK